MIIVTTRQGISIKIYRFVRIILLKMNRMNFVQTLFSIQQRIHAKKIQSSNSKMTNHNTLFINLFSNQIRNSKHLSPTRPLKSSKHQTILITPLQNDPARNFKAARVRESCARVSYRRRTSRAFARLSGQKCIIHALARTSARRTTISRTLRERLSVVCVYSTANAAWIYLWR